MFIAYLYCISLLRIFIAYLYCISSLHIFIAYLHCISLLFRGRLRFFAVACRSRSLAVFAVACRLRSLALFTVACGFACVNRINESNQRNEPMHRIHAPNSWMIVVYPKLASGKTKRSKTVKNEEQRQNSKETRTQK